MDKKKEIPSSGETFKRPSQAKEIWRRFKKNKGSVIGLIILIAMALVIIVGPMIIPYEDAIIQRRKNTSSVFTLQCCKKNIIAELRFFRQHRAMAVCAKNIFVADTFRLIFTVIMNIHLKTPTDMSSPCHLPRCLSVYRRVYRTAAAQWDLLCRRQPACPRP